MAVVAYDCMACMGVSMLLCVLSSLATHTLEPAAQGRVVEAVNVDHPYKHTDTCYDLLNGKRARGVKW